MREFALSHTAALDPATADKVLELTKRIVAENHITCLMITHNMHDALTLGNRTLMMDRGRIVLDVGGEERAHLGVNELLERFGLGADGHKKPAALSGGQQQRVAIARAIAAKPGILLLDEPTSALDPEYTTEVLDIVNELKEEGLDFIIVTHEMGFARHACEKAAFLCEGKLMEYGSGSEIFDAPKSEQLKNFLGRLLEWNM